MPNKIKPLILEDFILGNELIKYTETIENPPNRRDIFANIQEYLDCQHTPLVCVLYGLRRTGKTTMMDQILCATPKNILKDKCALITIDSKTPWTMFDLKQALKYFDEKGITQVFIDEATYISDFCSTASFLSNVFCKTGMRIVLSGTDSLAFQFAEQSSLFDRVLFLHTTYISFSEHSRISGINSIDDYIEKGGLFKNRKVLGKEVSIFPGFKNGEELAKYIDSAIIDNILHAIDLDNSKKIYYKLFELKQAGELKNAISRVVLNRFHEMTVRTFLMVFKNHDWGPTLESLEKRNKNDEKIATAIDIMDSVRQDGILMEEFMRKFGIIEFSKDYKIAVDEICVAQLEAYLRSMDLFEVIPEISYIARSNTGKPKDDWIYSKTFRHILAQPAIRYSYTKELLSIFQNMLEINGKKITDEIKEIISTNIISQVKGEIMENIVLHETIKSAKLNTEADRFSVFQLNFSSDSKLGLPSGEIDMIIHDVKRNCCALYEIKHSGKINDKQTRHLGNPQVNDLIEAKFGQIVSKNVIYRGEDIDTPDGIIRLNVEKWLTGLNSSFPEPNCEEGEEGRVSP